MADFAYYPSTSFPDNLFFALRHGLAGDSRDINDVDGETSLPIPYDCADGVSVLSVWLFSFFVGFLYFAPLYLVEVVLEDARNACTPRVFLDPDFYPCFVVYRSVRAVRKARAKRFWAVYSAQAERRRRARGPVCFLSEDSEDEEGGQRPVDWTRFDFTPWRAATAKGRYHTRVLRSISLDSPESTSSLWSDGSPHLYTPDRNAEDLRILRRWLWRKTKFVLKKWFP